jgi:hypothetical protein
MIIPRKDVLGLEEMSAEEILGRSGNRQPLPRRLRPSRA